MSSKIKLKNNLNTEFSIEHKDNEQAISVSSIDISKVKSVNTIADLRALTQTPPTIWVSGYHTKGDGAFGSHIFEWDENCTEKHNGGTIIDLNADFPTDWTDETQVNNWFNYSSTTNGRYKLKYDSVIDAKWFGIIGNGYSNIGIANSLGLQNAINLGGEIFIPSGYYRLSYGLVVPYKLTGKIGIKGSGQDSTILISNYNNSDKFMLDINPDENGSTFLGWGIRIENIYFEGYGQNSSAIRAKNIGYLLMRNVMINNFVGCGLYLDKVQDSDISNCNIQLCGKSTGDGTINSETTHHPITITSSINGDACNMIRFNSLQVEQNRVSPYVYCNSGIGLMFSQWHSEIRHQNDWYKHDLFSMYSCDATFTDMNINRFRKSLIYGGYGVIKISGGRSFGALGFDTNGKKGTLYLSNTNFISGNPNAGVTTWTSGLINVYAENCSFEDLKLTYPAGHKIFVGCTFNSLEFYQTGGSSQKQDFIDCTINGDFTGDISTKNINFLHGVIKGNLNGLGAVSTLLHTKLEGSISYSASSVKTFLPMGNGSNIIQESYTPKYNHWYVGDKVYNTSPANGSNIGWVCVADGAPGTWKPFGVIENLGNLKNIENNTLPTSDPKVAGQLWNNGGVVTVSAG